MEEKIRVVKSLLANRQVEQQNRIPIKSVLAKRRPLPSPAQSESQFLDFKAARVDDSTSTADMEADEAQRSGSQFRMLLGC